MEVGNAALSALSQSVSRKCYSDTSYPGLCHKKSNAQNPIGGPASNGVKKLMQLDILSINFRSLVARRMVVLAKPNLL